MQACCPCSLLCHSDPFSLVMVAGMFLWLRLTHVRDSRALIQEKARERKVLLVPGADFSSEEGAVSSCVRASFSTASAVDMEEAVRPFTLYLPVM
jgi:DNA-binding transcriptional MocR family regulator